VYWQEENLGRNTSVVRLEDGSKLPKQLVDEVAAAQKRLIVPMVWGRGDFAVIDNTRACTAVAHSRILVERSSCGWCVKWPFKAREQCLLVTIATPLERWDPDHSDG